MGRPSNREMRRAEILQAFARVLADHGYAGATIVAIAAQAGIAPGLVHHHFDSKAEMVSALLQDLVSRFRERVRRYQEDDDEDALIAYIDAALKLDERADQTIARCWVGLFAEAVRSPVLFAQMRRVLDGEMAVIERRSNGSLSSEEAGAVLAFIVGALVLGAFAPRKTAGFAAPALRRFVTALRVVG